MTGDDLAREVQARCDARVAEAVAAERQRIAETLRAAAAGRREYLRSLAGALRSDPKFAGKAELLELEAATIESCAAVVEGDLQPLYGWLPSWRWTDEMVARLYGEKSPPDPPPTARATTSP